MRALIVEDGHSRGAVAAARALARAGWRVALGSPGRAGLASGSRSVASTHDVPDAAGDEQRFLKAVSGAIGASDAEVVFGAGDAELLALSAHRDDLRAVVPLADHATVLRALDKGSLADAARAVGLDVPKNGEHLEPPVVVKARRHAAGGSARLEAEVCADREAVAMRVAELSAAGGEPLIQERLAGKLIAYIAFTARDGQVLASLQQEADAIWPEHTGVSVRARTVPVNETLAAGAALLLAELGWFGIAELQFLSVPARGPVLIDFNGRFYGSLALAVAAGVNLPAMWAAAATRRKVPTPRAARVGVRYQWLEGELRLALTQRRVPLRALAYAPGAAHSIWSASDPKPALLQALRLAAGAGRKLRR
jgi:predicted ATP-grasp superfamily ATP-dependent carboligase